MIGCHSNTTSDSLKELGGRALLGLSPAGSWSTVIIFVLTVHDVLQQLLGIPFFQFFAPPLLADGHPPWRGQPPRPNHSKKTQFILATKTYGVW